MSLQQIIAYLGYFSTIFYQVEKNCTTSFKIRNLTYNAHLKSSWFKTSKYASLIKGSFSAIL